MAGLSKLTKAQSPKDRVKKIIRGLERTHPDAKLDLDFSSPLELLIALILAAQARDDLVNQITSQLFKKYRSAADYARASETELQNDVRKINFYRNKTRSIQKCCATLVERFGGKVPDRLDDLLALPGVGRKTANILLGNAFGKQAIGVDTHVMRLSQRLKFTGQDEPDKIEADLMNVVPENQRTRFCHLLQYHGRRVCLGRKPKCPECSINAFCPYPEKTVY
ncbi:MAG: endonuclease III [Candidatus Binatia bacterium]|jgi:endonuclease-3